MKQDTHRNGEKGTDKDQNPQFQPAQAFYRRNRTKTPPESPPAAVGIIWYDIETPLYVCEDCEEAARSVRWQGPASTTNPEERRQDAYERLVFEGVACDGCTGEIDAKLRGGE